MLELFPELWISGLFTALGVLLGVLFLARPSLARSRSGALLGALALGGLPLFLLWIGMDVHVQHSKETDFCLSCHSMLPYGQSLTEAEEGMLAGVHFEHHYVPQEYACYSCHTEYTLYGGLKAKFAGLQHMWHSYVVGVPDPIELYGDYANRECLRCHEGVPSFVQQPAHEGQLEELSEGALSCLLCHGPLHGVEEGEVTAALEGRTRFRLPETLGRGGTR